MPWRPRKSFFQQRRSQHQRGRRKNGWCLLPVIGSWRFPLPPSQGQRGSEVSPWEERSQVWDQWNNHKDNLEAERWPCFAEYLTEILVIGWDPQSEAAACLRQTCGAPTMDDPSQLVKMRIVSMWPWVVQYKRNARRGQNVKLNDDYQTLANEQAFDLTPFQAGGHLGHKQAQAKPSLLLDTGRWSDLDVYSTSISWPYEIALSLSLGDKLGQPNCIGSGKLGCVLWLTVGQTHWEEDSQDAGSVVQVVSLSYELGFKGQCLWQGWLCYQGKIEGHRKQNHC